MLQSKYAKAIIATLIAVASALVTALGTSPQQNLSHLSTQTWLTAIAAILGSGALTWWAENVQGVAGGIIKAAVASAGAFITVLITAYGNGGPTQAQWITAFSAALVALAAVYQTKNASQS